MVIAALLLAQAPAATAQTKDAKAQLFEALEHYRTLDSFSATIEQNESSGLFPGKFTQSLKWKKGGKFELIVTKPAVYSDDSVRRNDAPSYYADGKTVTSLYPDGSKRENTEANEPNMSPGWDVSGGLILSFLQRSSTYELLRKPPEGFNISYSLGPAKTWEGQDVRDIVMTFEIQGQKVDTHVYLAAGKSQVVGMTSAPPPGKLPGSMVYRDQKENPPLPDSLGTVPNK